MKGARDTCGASTRGRSRPPALRIRLRVPASEPDRNIDVPESEWDKVEILTG